MQRLALLLSLTLCLVLGLAVAQDAAIVQRYTVYADGPAPQHQVAPWSTRSDERDDGPPRGRYLWLNDDWQAKPWAGVRFARQAGEPLVLDQAWLKFGFVRFMINAGFDAYGSPNANLAFQARPDCEGLSYQQLRPRFIERGRGLDEDPGTWQEVLIPLSYWTELKAGARCQGITIQCYDRPMKSWGFDDVELVRYDRLPDWVAALETINVKQPEVAWPSYDELPEVLKSDQHPPRVVDGKFVTPDGRRTFILNPYLREDPRLDLHGNLEGRIPPAHNLYDPDKHGWIYEQLPDAQTLCRLGFNSYSATMPGKPWWTAAGYDAPDRGEDASRLPAYAKQVGLPFYVDLVCWPWTIGAPASKPDQTKLPAEAFTNGREHWVPYRLTGPGRQAWRDMFRVYAERYRDAGVPTLMLELFNEPAYTDLGSTHLAEFERWLQVKYASIDDLNRTWQTAHPSFAAAAAIPSIDYLKDHAGPFLDYDEYLAARFTSLVDEGVKDVTAILPGTLVGVQTMGGYSLQPREAVWKHTFAKHETVVLTPTGGGRWTDGAGNAKPPTTLCDAAMAAAPVENDLLLALAGDKMLVDNETYLRGQTRLETRNRLWEHVIAGLDGLTVFSWSKRGWSWWKDDAALVTEADKYPYAGLIPLARRTDALRGILDFAVELQPIADRILRKPWGRQVRVGVVYSWEQARRRAFEPSLRDKTPAYYAALKYSHWLTGLVPSDQLTQPDGLREPQVLILGGIRHLSPAAWSALDAWVRQGHALIVAEEPAALDLYGQPLPAHELLPATFNAPAPSPGKLALPAGTMRDRMPGDVTLRTPQRTLTLKPGAEALVSTADGQPLVAGASVGGGLVYVSGADLVGYPLAKLLSVILEDAARRLGRQGALLDSWREVEVLDGDGHLAPNVLSSWREYPSHRALLLQNREGYAQTVTLQAPGEPAWQVTDALRGQRLALPREPVKVTIPAGEPAVLLYERSEVGQR